LAGTDTARGISFQHAQAVSACLDVLESSDAAYIHLEGVEDVVDFEVRSHSRRRIRVAQAKTKQEPYTWAPGEIVEIIESWQGLELADEAEFDFLTDGSAGPELARRLQPALSRARRGDFTSADREYLSGKGLHPEDPLLARVTLHSRQPDADTLLDTVALRLLRLLEMGAGDAATETAEEHINSLFRLVSIRAGDSDPDARRIARDELSEIVGVPVEVIDEATAWGEEPRQLYVEALRADPPHPSFVLLQAEQLSLRPDALALVLQEQPDPGDSRMTVPAARLLDEAHGALLSGAAGTGKTTTLQLLVPEALNRDLLPILASVETYAARALPRLVREALEERTGKRLAPGAARAVLAGARTILLLDGAGELNDEARAALVTEVQTLRRAHPELRLILTARNPARLRATGLPSYLLQGLDHEQRRRVARELLDRDAEVMTAGVEARLGDLVDRPLLFVMALSLAERGVQPTDRAGLFRGFLEGLQARPGGEALTDLGIAALRDACFSLRSEDRYAADRWTWRTMLADALERLKERGLFDTANVAADNILSDGEGGGLLRSVPVSSLVALTHDLFCDFLAAEAIRLGQRSLPEQVDERFEEVAVFMSEQRALTHEMARAVCSDGIVAARSAAASPETNEAPPNEVAELFHCLLQYLGPDIRTRLEETAVRLVRGDDGAYIFLAADTAEADGFNAAEGARSSPRVVFLRGRPATLAAAVALWLAELREALSHTRRDVGTMLPIPTEREAMPAALVEAFQRRRDELHWLCNEVCPGIGDRVVREVNLRGLRAVVQPVVERSMPFGGGTTIRLHPMAYSYNTPDVDVRVADEVDDDFLPDPSTNASVEDWLQHAPADAAAAEVRRALQELLPGYTRG
jgi:hypothetical protein